MYNWGEPAPRGWYRLCVGFDGRVLFAFGWFAGTTVHVRTVLLAEGANAWEAERGRRRRWKGATEWDRGR